MQQPTLVGCIPGRVGVISTMIMNRMRATIITENDVNNDNHNEDDNNMNVNDDLVF